MWVINADQVTGDDSGQHAAHYRKSVTPVIHLFNKERAPYLTAPCSWHWGQISEQSRDHPFLMGRESQPVYHKACDQHRVIDKQR